MNTFVVISLFNEDKHISGVLKGISKYDIQIIVVDDGSIDKSWSLSKASKIKNITLLRHKINLGKGAAMKTGAEYAFDHGADAVIFMDADGQHESADLPKFIEKLNLRKYDVIFGSRNLNYGVPLIRYLGNKIASICMAALFGVYISDAICGFRAITKLGYKKIKWESKGYGVEAEMVARVGKMNVKHCEVPVETIYHDRVKGVTLLDAFGILGEVVKWRLTI